ncbi:class I SAM-dependent methyltransferase [Bradyrhizobium sp. USDA 4504]
MEMMSSIGCASRESLPRRCQMVQPVQTTDRIPPLCPICRYAQTQIRYEVAGYDIWRCPECATDFVYPVPNAAELTALYDREDWFEGGERGGYSSYDGQTDPAPQWLVRLLDRFKGVAGSQRILDIGSAYGTHLDLAYQKGWACYGVEPSAHARRICRERHPQLYVTATVDDVPATTFDLILLLDVIEHVADPYEVLFKLFSRGAVTPNTVFAITTPNSRSSSAVQGGADWAYCHPPSHLVFYSGASFEVLLKTLRFRDVEVVGQHPVSMQVSLPLPNDEPTKPNAELMPFEGLLVTASGSDFAEFMHERFVPGTYNELTEYEHLPRYELASTYCTGKRVLDFGCGTGYGAARLARNATEVIGIDSSPGAICFAASLHREGNLQFREMADFADGFPDASFDVIVCFEVIEHLSIEDQGRAVESFRRLLRTDGTLIVSTPNRLVTAYYAPNPYHLHEMSKDEFQQLIAGAFKYCQIIEQRINATVVFSEHDQLLGKSTLHLMPNEGVGTEPVAYLAIAGHQPINVAERQIFADASRDFVKRTVSSIGNQLKETRNEYQIFLLERRVAELTKESKGCHLSQEAISHYRGLSVAEGPIRTLLASGLFDLAEYSKRAGLSVDGEELCAAHYLLVGEKEGIAPSQLFDPTYYFTEYPDVRESGMPAVLHYLRFGRYEGRFPKRPDESAVS